MQMNLFVYDENMMCQSAMKVVLAIESGYHRRIAAIISLTNRFHVAVRLSGNRPQMTSICGAESSGEVSLMLLSHFDLHCI